MSRLYLSLAAASGFLAVAFGAFGAHALRDSLDAYSLSVFDTAVRYHFVHTLALLGVALLARREFTGSRWLDLSGAFFIMGILVFSGSLYALSITGLRWLGAVTPLGGVALLCGWLALLTASLRDGTPGD